MRSLRKYKNNQANLRIVSVWSLIILFGLIIYLLIPDQITPRAQAATFTVTNTNDSGAGSLRQAITDANNTAGADVINFNIPTTDPGCNATTGVCTIIPLSRLEVRTNITIDGYTQPGASPNTLAQGGNAVLKIELQGGSNGGNSGIDVCRCGGAAPGPNDSVIRGLIINRFTPSSGIAISIASGVRIEGNFIGTDSTGTVRLANGVGISVSFDSSNNIIGGTAPEARNIISGNNGNGVNLNPSQSSSFVNGTLVTGNLIGTAKDGTSALGNGAAGVSMVGNTFDSRVEGNVIAFNAGNGVSLSTPNNSRNRILSNSIFSNGRLGIDLGNNNVVQLNDAGDADTGPNSLQNYPVLSSAVSSSGSTTVQGTLNSTANTTYNLEFFDNAACDSSGNGEGQIFIGSTSVTTDATGNASFDITFPVAVASNRFITSTATDPVGNTSEFSVCRQLIGPTAASVVVGGRIRTASGRGISSALVMLTNAAGETRTARTNAFGFYRFEDVSAGETYIFSVFHKRHFFADAPRMVFVAGELDDNDFAAQ
ncbi:MAG: carboxypeptidase-like regulatory domain-containing protein [Acidobacteriota bacterium]|nr:carboxypeptidase-like regulatory domain-containing protein [Acidobacteriota bacterium]